MATSRQQNKHIKRNRATLHVWATVLVFMSIVGPSFTQTSCVQTICPAGKYCRLVAANAECVECDYGYFGVNCTSSCHCLNNDFCNKTDGLCSNWKCDRGYTGLPECQQLCPNLTFGLDCALECHCPTNDNCSNVNGDCSSGRCHPDWGSAACQRRLPKLALPPRVLEVKCANITVGWTSFNETNDIGKGPVAQYRLYKTVSQLSSNQWQLVDNITVISGKSLYTYSITAGLVPGTMYNFRVDVVGEEFGKPAAQISTGALSDALLYICTTTAAPNATTPKPIISRKVFDQINMTAINSTTVNISWLVLPEVSAYQYNVTVTSQFIGNGDCDTSGNGSDIRMYGPYNIQSSPVIISGLLVWSTYRISVTATALAADVWETYNENVTTLSSTPVGTVTDLKFEWLTSTEIEVSWTPVRCDQRRGPFVAYDVHLALVLASGSIANQTITATQETRQQLTGLIPFSQYSVQIFYRNNLHLGPASQPLNFTTLEGVPGPVEITQLVPTSSTVTVSFQSPSQPNGVVTSYSATYAESISFTVSLSVTVAAVQNTSGSFHISVERLKPETLYYFKVAASTSKGIGAYGTVKPVQTLRAPASGDVMIVSLISRTNSCLTLGWSPPDKLVANITSFVLEIKRVSADTTTPPFRADIPKSQKSYEVCELKSSTLYEVSVSGISTSAVISTTTENFSTVHGTPPTPVAPLFVRSNFTNITIAIEPVISPDVPVTAYQIQAFLVPADGRRKRLAAIPGYVAAELSPSEVLQRREFTLGDGKSYGGFENKALQQNSYYSIYYIVLSLLNGDTTASWSQLKTNAHTVPFDSTLAPPIFISLDSKNMTCLNFSWTLPQGVENTLTGITLTVKKTSEDTTVISTDLSLTTQSYQICNLAPFTLYKISVTARTTDGTAIISSETFSTVHNTPATPPAPILVSSSYTTITISIEPAVLTDAPLTAYQLQVEKLSSGRRKRVAEIPGYVTAQLDKENVTRKMNFIVGDGHSYGGYLNKPLDRDSLYVIHYIVVSSASGITKFSNSSLLPAVRTVPNTISVASQSDSENTVVLMGVMIALILLTLLILLLILLYWCWKQRNRFNPYKAQEDKNTLIFPELQDDYNSEQYWSTIYDLKNSRHIVAGRDLVYKKGHVPLKNGAVVPQAGLPNISFSNEFQNLPHSSDKATDNLARQHNEVNRFPHLLPYDHSLVHLRPDESSQQTYINASFIPGYKKSPAYIAAQSPFDEDTVLDFWRLIYQNSIETVVMITNTVEDNMVMCTQYWPDETKASFGDFLLNLVETTEYADYIIRTVAFKTSHEEQFRAVKIFEFTSWPEHGVPEDPIPFIQMRHAVRGHHQDHAGPILVHCGTGMGRTGVFIAVDALTEQYAAEGRVMVFDFVNQMRKNRPFMVRTMKQYVFIYEALFEQFHAGDTLVDFNLKDVYHSWTQKNPRTGQTYLRDQYTLLETYTRGPRRDEFKTALLEANIKKNRYLDVLAPEKYRPLLKSLGGPNSTDYINALFVDGYLTKNQFIITQTPLSTTITDFWKLVYDYSVSTIVMVENWKNEDETCAHYWSDTQAKLTEPFVVETTVAYQHDNITLRSFRIHNTQHPKRPARLVMQFQFNAWARPNLTPQSKTMMMDLIDDVFSWQQKACGNKNPIIVHCQDGASHSGLFAVLAVICEKMKQDKEVDIYKTVKHCKRRRTQFIADYDQLRFCYKAAWDYMNLRMPGGTFTETLGQSKSDQLYGVASFNLSSLFDNINNQEMII